MPDKEPIASRAGERRSEPAQVAAIPLVEERLSVSKKEVESGRVKIHVTVEERQETVSEELRRDDVQIERVPRNVRLSEIPHVRLEGTTTIIPVVEEVVVVEKALMLVEEIHVRRMSETEVQEVPVTVRVERVSVAREPTGSARLQERED